MRESERIFCRKPFETEHTANERRKISTLTKCKFALTVARMNGTAKWSEAMSKRISKILQHTIYTYSLIHRWNLRIEHKTVLHKQCVAQQRRAFSNAHIRKLYTEHTVRILLLSLLHTLSLGCYWSIVMFSFSLLSLTIFSSMSEMKMKKRKIWKNGSTSSRRNLRMDRWFKSRWKLWDKTHSATAAAAAMKINEYRWMTLAIVWVGLRMSATPRRSKQFSLSQHQTENTKCLDDLVTSQICISLGFCTRSRFSLSSI